MIKSEKASLYSCDYIFGHLPDVDTKAIEKMVLENHKKKRMTTVKMRQVLDLGHKSL